MAAITRYIRLRLLHLFLVALFALIAIVNFHRFSSIRHWPRRGSPAANLGEFEANISLPRRITRVDKRPAEGGVMAQQTPAAALPSAAADAKLVCRVPQLQLGDPQLARYFWSVRPLRCAKEKNWVFVGADHTFQIDPAAVERRGKITCSYEHFWRESDRKVGRRVYEDYKSGSPLLGDFFRAYCMSEDKHNFTNVYATVVPSAKAIERARAVKPPENWSGLSVYHLGFDSISRMTFQRKMKLTYKFITEELDAVVLKGYNIVGDGTPQAFIPILTGQTELELPLTRKRFRKADFVNVYPFVWKDFDQNGFVTLYGEDTAAVGTFTYRLKGFDEQPTDHYTRTLFTVAERMRLKGECFGSEPLHTAYLRYAEDFFAAYPEDIPKFAVHFHGRLSHGDIEQADADTTAHLKRMRDSGQLNKTLLIMMADHGHRFAKMRATHQGMLEERLPMYALAAPGWWREGPGKTAWANLRLNADRLTSPFDIHATLLRVLHWREPGKGDVRHRSIALWDQVPPERSCSQAGIADHWCTCLDWRPVPSHYANLAVGLAGSVVVVINRETEAERRLCAPLKLTKLDTSRMLVPKDDMLKYKQSKDHDGFVPDLSGKTKLVFAKFQLRFWTEPGDALYEATVHYDMRKDEVKVDLGAVSHINRYGDKPHCIIDKDYFLAKWCVCYDRI